MRSPFSRHRREPSSPSLTHPSPLAPPPPPSPMSAPPPLAHLTVIKKNGRDGPRFLLEPSKRLTYTIGSAPTNHIHMALPDVAEHHATILIDENHAVSIAHTAPPHLLTFLNDSPLPSSTSPSSDPPATPLLSTPLQHLDVIRIANRLFRIEYASLSAPPSTPTKAPPSPSPSPSPRLPPASPTSSTPRRPRISAEGKPDSNGNTGSTAAGDRPHGHTSTPTPNRRKSVTKQGGGGVSPSGKGKGEGATESNQTVGTPTSDAKREKKRPSMPSTPTLSPSPSTSARPPSPAPSTPTKPRPELLPSIPAPSDSSATPPIAQSDESSSLSLSPQSIADISASSPSDSSLDVLPFDLPMCGGPLTTLMEDPEEEDDPPAPHTRRWLPTPVRREVEEKAAVIAEKAREKLREEEGEGRGKGEAEVSVSDVEVCVVDEEIVFSPGTLHRKALQARHIRYGRVIAELKAKLHKDGEEAREEDVEMEVEELSHPPVAAAPAATDSEAVLEEEMEMEEVLEVDAGVPGSPEPVVAAAPIVLALPTPVRRAIKERPARPIIPITSAPTLPTPVKKDIRAGRTLKPVQELGAGDARAEEVEEQGTAFLPVAELIAHERRHSTRQSLPAETATRSTRPRSRARASASPALSTATDAAKDQEAEMKPSLSLPITHADVSLDTYSAASPTARLSSSSSGAVGADDDSPASPPLSATVSLDNVPSTPSSPSKASTDRHSLRSVESDHPVVSKPLPSLPTPVRRSITERDTALEQDLAPLKMQTPLKRADEGGQEKTETSGTVPQPSFTAGPVSARRSLPTTLDSARKGRRPQTRRVTMAPKLTLPEREEPHPTDEVARTEEGTASDGDDAMGETVLAQPLGAAVPSSRQSFPLPVRSGRSAKREQRLTAHTQLSSLPDDSSPCSPPATSTIPSNEIPPTPSTPHKSSAAKRLSRAVESVEDISQQPTVSEVESTQSPFIPLDRPVDSRQSLPAQRRTAGPIVQRTSAGARVQSTSAEESPAVTDAPEEAVQMDIDDASELREVEFITRMPATRQSLPTQSSSALTRTQRRSAAPAAVYEDAEEEEAQRPSLPSPLRRGIEQRPSRVTPAMLNPLSSPVKRAIKQGVVLRAPPAAAVPSQLGVQEEVGEETVQKAAEEPAAQAGDVMPLETEVSQSSEPQVVQAAERKSRGRKRKVEVEAPTAPTPSPPVLAAATRKRVRVRAEELSQQPASSAIGVDAAPLPVIDAPRARTRKAALRLHVSIEEPAAAQVQAPAVQETTTRTTRTRKRRVEQEETAVAEGEPDSSIPSAPARASRRGRRQAEEEEVDAELMMDVPDVPSQRRGRAKRVAAEEGRDARDETPSTKAQPKRTTRSRRNAGEPAPTAPLVLDGLAPSTTRKGNRRQPRSDAQGEEKAAGEVVTAQTRSSRTRKGQQRPAAKEIEGDGAGVEEEETVPSKSRQRGVRRLPARGEAEETATEVVPSGRGRRRQPSPPATAEGDAADAVPATRRRVKTQAAAAPPFDSLSPAQLNPPQTGRITRSKARG